jgi:hypothetical protein
VETTSQIYARLFAFKASTSTQSYIYSPIYSFVPIHILTCSINRFFFLNVIEHLRHRFRFEQSTPHISLAFAAAKKWREICGVTRFVSLTSLAWFCNVTRLALYTTELATSSLLS